MDEIPSHAQVAATIYAGFLQAAAHRGIITDKWRRDLLDSACHDARAIIENMNPKPKGGLSNDQR